MNTTLNTEAPSAARAAAQALSAAGRAIAPTRGPAEERAATRRSFNLLAVPGEATLAIEAAATARERALIEAIFSAIPDCIAKSQAHSDAEMTGDPGAESFNRAWVRASTAILAKLEKVMDLPAAGPAHALRRIKLFTRVRYLLDFASGDGHPLSGDLSEEDVRQIAHTALLALEQAAAPPPPSKAALAFDRIAAQYAEAHQAAKTENFPKTTAGDEAWEAADERECALFGRLMATPAPDAAATVLKIAALIDNAWADEAGDSATNPETIGRMLNSGGVDEAWPVAILYQDAIRQAGDTENPLLSLTRNTADIARFAAKAAARQADLMDTLKSAQRRASAFIERYSGAEGVTVGVAEGKLGLVEREDVATPEIRTAAREAASNQIAHMDDGERAAVIAALNGGQQPEAG